MKNNTLKFLLLITGIVSAAQADVIDTSKMVDQNGATLIKAIASGTIDFQPKNCQELQNKGLAVHEAIEKYAEAKFNNMKDAVKQNPTCDLNDEIKDFEQVVPLIKAKSKAIHTKVVK